MLGAQAREQLLLEAADIGRFEQELLSRLRTQHTSLLSGVREKKALTPELESELKSMLESFTSACTA